MAYAFPYKAITPGYLLAGYRTFTSLLPSFDTVQIFPGIVGKIRCFVPVQGTRPPPEPPPDPG